MNTKEEEIWDELIDTREQLLKVRHLAHEALEGSSVIANLASPHIMRLKAQMRRKEDKIVFNAILEAYKQVQQRIAIIVEELEGSHE